LTTELDLYRKMLTIRLLEDELQKLCLTGEAGDLHFSKGEEAISVGASAELRPTDYIVTHHRTISHSIAQGIPLKPLVAEILGKATGINHGMAGEMHLRYPKAGFMFSFQLVGTCVPVAAGLAWAVKYYKKEDSIVACFFGDAASSNGQTHEGLNIAAVRRLPLLLICENNGLAGNIRKELYLPTPTVAARAAAYGIQSKRIDGNRLPEVMTAVKEAAAKVRGESKPFLLEMETTRLSWHKQGQPDTRSKEELAELAKRDPLLYEENRLRLRASQRSAFENEIHREIADAIEEARRAPFPVFQGQQS
jgi:TPP-dependent pyruvate/acetoin dehydrogenase alpha subunit